MLNSNECFMWIWNISSAKKKKPSIISREDHVLSFFSIFPFPLLNQAVNKCVARSAFRVHAYALLICKLIKMKSGHRMVFKKFKWNNLHRECVKRLMRSFTKPHNHSHPFSALIVFHMDALIHYCQIINIKNISVLIFLLFVKAQSTTMS